MHGGMGERQAPRLRVGAFILQGGRLLLVQQRRASEPAAYWLLPGGGLRSGETFADALCREVREELGAEVQPGRPIALAESISPDPAYPKHVIHIIITASLASPSEAQALTPRDPGVLAVRLFSADELPDLPLRPPLGLHLARYIAKLPHSVDYLGRVW